MAKEEANFCEALQLAKWDDLMKQVEKWEAQLEKSPGPVTRVRSAQELLLLQEQEATKRYSDVTPQMLRGIYIPELWKAEYPPRYRMIKPDMISMVQRYDNTDPIKQTGGKKMKLFAREATVVMSGLGEDEVKIVGEGYISAESAAYINITLRELKERIQELQRDLRLRPDASICGRGGYEYDADKEEVTKVLPGELNVSQSNMINDTLGKLREERERHEEYADAEINYFRDRMIELEQELMKYKPREVVLAEMDRGQLVKIAEELGVAVVKNFGPISEPGPLAKSELISDIIKEEKAVEQLKNGGAK